MNMDIKNIKKEFPIFKQNAEVVYFDSASTTQKPKIVIEEINNYLTKFTANAGRGNYNWANIVNTKIDDTRDKVAKFINATNDSEVLFTSGATESVNTIAYSWGLNNLKNGDEILFNPLDHESNIAPWFNIKKILKKQGVNIKMIPYGITVGGEGDTNDIYKKITSKTHLIVATHIHNVFGTRTTLRELINKIPKRILVAMDCSQSIGHIEVDVQKLKLDFAYFSGHKMFASTGIGVLYIKSKHHSKLTPFIRGGNSDSIDNRLPQLLEAGTQNILGILSIGSAINFIEKVGINNIHQYNLELTQYLVEQLKKINGIEFLPGVALCGCKIGYGVVSFKMVGMSASDVGFILNSKNIFVRTGNHCTYGSDIYKDSIRVSMHIYNTKSEIITLVKALKEIAATI